MDAESPRTANRAYDRHGRSLEDFIETFELPSSRRLKFVSKIYGYAVIYALLTILQCLIVLFVPEIKNFLFDFIHFGFMFACIALIALSLFINFHVLRHKKPINYIFVGIMVELTVISAAFFISHYSNKDVGICASVTITAFSIASFIAIIVPKDLTQSYMLINVFGICLLFIGFIVIVMMVIETIKNVKFIFGVLGLIYLEVFHFYQTQLIFGNRLLRMRANEELLCSVLVYLQCIVMFLTFLTFPEPIKNGDI